MTVREEAKQEFEALYKARHGDRGAWLKRNQSGLYINNAVRTEWGKFWGKYPKPIYTEEDLDAMKPFPESLQMDIQRCLETDEDWIYESQDATSFTEKVRELLPWYEPTGETE